MGIRLSNTHDPARGMCSSLWKYFVTFERLSGGSDPPLGYLGTCSIYVSYTYNNTHTHTLYSRLVVRAEDVYS